MRHRRHLFAAAAASLMFAAPAPVGHAAPISKVTWLDGFTLTEYWSAPEKWFKGARVLAPGLVEPHRVDFLYSARGVAMEGDGTTLSGGSVHLVGGLGGYLDRRAGRTGTVFWADEMYWLSASGEITFPLEAGGWSNGSWASARPRTRIAARTARFATGPSDGASGLPLHPGRSAAVDPRLIAYRSAIWVPARGRWYCAADTGGAIVGRHLDLFRSAPASPSLGETLTDERVRIYPPDLARKFLPLVCAR